MDSLFDQSANISKAGAYDILAEQVKELKEVIRQLIAVGELYDLTFTDPIDTDNFKKILTKARILSL